MLNVALFIFMLNAAMLNATMLNVAMLMVVMLSIVMLSVMAMKDFKSVKMYTDKLTTVGLRKAFRYSA